MADRTTRTSTSERVVAAATELFSTRGYARTSMEQIRLAAGVSNGSLYHAFSDKVSLAAHLFSAGMQQCQSGLLEAIERAEIAQQGVRDAVCWQLQWVDDNAATARILYSDTPDDVLVAASTVHDPGARDYVRVTTRWLKRHITDGAIVDRPFQVTHALWLGPAQEYSRHWLHGRATRRPGDVVRDFADGAWAALST